MAFAVAATAQSPQLRVPLAEFAPELSQLSPWRLVRDATNTATPLPRAAFPIGNGRVFAGFGLGDAASTMTHLRGPGLVGTKPFGALALRVRVDGRERALPRQTVVRVHDSGFVVTEDRDDRGLALRTLNWVEPDSDLVLRWIAVHNDGPEPLANVQVTALLAGGDARDGRLAATTTGTAGPRALRVQFLGAAEVVGDELVHELGRIEPGRSGDVELLVRVWTPDGTKLWLDPEPGTTPQRAERTLQHWRRRLQGTTTFACDDDATAGAFADGKVLLLLAHDAATGGFVPLLRDAPAPLAEQVGPLLGCLRSGLFGEARALLAGIAATTRALQSVPTTFPVAGCAVTTNDPPPRAEDALTLPHDGTASLLVLMHHWYWRATGDDALLRAHLPLLHRCLDGQRFSSAGLQPFPPGAPELAATWTALGAEVPAGALAVTADGARPWSLPALVQFLLANAALGEIEAALAERDADAAVRATAPAIRAAAIQRAADVARIAEERFWSPALDRFAIAAWPAHDAQSGERLHDGVFADAALGLPWLGWTFASQQRTQRHLAASLRALWRAPGEVRVGATATSGIATVPCQAQLLAALATERDGAWSDAWRSLLRRTTAAGHWPAAITAEGTPLALGDDGLGGLLSPHATGMALDAMAFACTGVRMVAIPGFDGPRQAHFRPRLPPGARTLQVQDHRSDGRRLTMRWTQTDDTNEPQLRVRITAEAPPPDEAHVVCAVDVGASTLVRYLAVSLPAIDDTVPSPVDAAGLWPAKPKGRTPDGRKPNGQK
jgi:hypothetical protein